MYILCIYIYPEVTNLMSHSLELNPTGSAFICIFIDFEATNLISHSILLHSTDIALFMPLTLKKLKGIVHAPNFEKIEGAYCFPNKK